MRKRYPFVNGVFCAGAVLAAEPTIRAADTPNIMIIFTDDHGYADLGTQGVDPDVRTPNIDRLAGDGVLFTRGYSTAPQCIPSRAGLVSGRHQNAFGLEDNANGPLSHDEYTVAERLRDAGYVTGAIGKWHLEVGYNEKNKPYYSREHLPHRHGFEEIFSGYTQDYHATYDLAGNTIEGGPKIVNDPHFRIDVQMRAALAFLERRKTDARPFFLYLCPYAPHAPMEDPPQYMARMSHVAEKERRMALASILAIDDGIGLIRQKLEEMGLTENTLIFFMSDNGAPLFEGGYIGSLNTPMTGSKGMMTDGGLRVPYVAAWPGKIPGGQVFDEAVSTLDAAATALAVAAVPVDDKIEGVNLIPWLTGQQQGPVHEALFWRWRTQAAILSDGWKFVMVGNQRRYLFDLRGDGRETAADNRIDQYPELAATLEKRLRDKAASWADPNLPARPIPRDIELFDQQVEGTLPPPPLGKGKTGQFIPWKSDRPVTPISDIKTVK
jgi:arylsulfatase A-like enzyme